MSFSCMTCSELMRITVCYTKLKSKLKNILCFSITTLLGLFQSQNVQGFTPEGRTDFPLLSVSDQRTRASCIDLHCNCQNLALLLKKQGKNTLNLVCIRFPFRKHSANNHSIISLWYNENVLNIVKCSVVFILQLWELYASRGRYFVVVVWMVFCFVLFFA